MFITLPYPTEYASEAARTCQRVEGYRRQRARIVQLNAYARTVFANPRATDGDHTYWKSALISNRRFAANMRAVRHAFLTAYGV